MSVDPPEGNGPARGEEIVAEIEAQIDEESGDPAADPAADPADGAAERRRDPDDPDGGLQGDVRSEVPGSGEPPD